MVTMSDLQLIMTQNILTQERFQQMNNDKFLKQIEPFLTIGENRGCYLVPLPNGNFGPWFVALRQAIENASKENTDAK